MNEDIFKNRRDKMNEDIFKSITITKSVITATDAATMLESNTKNRPMRARHVVKLTNEMRSGYWKFNGDTIRISKEGIMLDGQHRLTACVKSGITFGAIIVSGLDADVFDTIDAGAKRMPSDALALKGEANSVALASSLVVMHHYLTGATASKSALTTPQTDEVLKAHPEIRKSVSLISNYAYRKFMPISVLAAYHYLFAKINEGQADAFMADLLTGANLDPLDPVLALRAKMIKNAMSTTKISKENISAVLVKAWNARRSGRFVKKLRWALDGSENFPKIK
jgi:hypothetical protein